MEYMNSYARHFGVLECIRFGSRVTALEYTGVDEEEVMAWEQWASNGEAFGSGRGEWRLTVQRGSDVEVRKYKSWIVAKHILPCSVVG
jgi:dimethylaniline monooxygenase (N-oxide forming)